MDEFKGHTWQFVRLKSTRMIVFRIKQESNQPFRCISPYLTIYQQIALISIDFSSLKYSSFKFFLISALFFMDQFEMIGLDSSQLSTLDQSQQSYKCDMEPDRGKMVIEETIRFFKQLRERHQYLPTMEFCSSLSLSLTFYQFEVSGSQIQSPAHVPQPSPTRSRTSYSSISPLQHRSNLPPESSEDCRLQIQESILQKREETKAIRSQELELGLIQASREGSPVMTTSIVNMGLREMEPTGFQINTPSIKFSPFKRPESLLQIVQRQPEEKNKKRWTQQSFKYSPEMSGYQVGTYFSPQVLFYTWKLLLNNITAKKEKVIFPKKDIDQKLKVCVTIVKNGKVYNESDDYKTFEKIEPLSTSLPSHIQIASTAKNGSVGLSLEDLPNITIRLKIFYQLSTFRQNWDPKKQGLIILCIKEEIKQFIHIFPEEIAARGWDKMDIYNRIAKKVGITQVEDIFKSKNLQIRTFEPRTSFINMKGAETISRREWVPK